MGAAETRALRPDEARPSSAETPDRSASHAACSRRIPLHAARTDPFEDGLITGLFDRNVTPTAYSPVAGAAIADVAAAHGTTRTAVALAWLLRHPAGIQPIVGTNRPERIREATETDRIRLDREQCYKIFTAGRGRDLP